MSQQSALREDKSAPLNWDLLETLCGRLATMVEAENVALEKGDIKGIKTGEPEFEHLSTQYGREIASLKAKGGAAEMPAAVRARLRQVGARLKTALEQHQILAEALRYVTEGMVQSVADEVVRQRKERAPYAPPNREAKPTQASALSAAIVYNKII
jgi:hypothetical protein